MKKYVLLLALIIAFSALAISAGAEDKLIMEDGCETESAGVTLMEGAPDKSKFYRVDGADLGFLPNETSSDFVYELDIRFNNEGCGFSFVKKGKWNSCVRVKDGNLALQTGGNSFAKLTKIDVNKWYHFTFLGRTNRDANAVTYGHIIWEEYDENGKRTNRQVFYNVNLRNNAATHYINAYGGCDIDNIRAYTPSPTALTLTSDGESVIAGGGLKFSATAYWNDLEMNGINSSMINFEVFDETNTYPLDDENVVITPDGSFETNPLTVAQDVTVRVTSKVSELADNIKVKIISSEIFTINAIGVNDSWSKVTEMKITKNFASYKESATFVVAFYNGDGTMNKIGYKTVFAENLTEGENTVNLGFDIPSGFNWEIGRIKAFVVTSFSGVDSKSAVKVTREQLSSLTEQATVITISENSDIEKITEKDILFFNVINAGEKAEIPSFGKTYVYTSVNKIDTLYEITN